MVAVRLVGISEKMLRKLSKSVVCGAMAVCGLVGSASAETWDGDATNSSHSGQWQTGGSRATNWVEGTIPNSAGATATFNNTALSANRNVAIMNVTAGVLNFDVNSGSGYVLSGGTLTLDNTGSTDAQVNVASTNSINHSISATITLNDNLVVSFGTSTSTLTLSGTISGTKTITATGNGTLVIATALSHTGGTAINGGVVRTDNANALGTTGTISFGGGTFRYGSGVTTDYSNRFSNAAGQNYRVDTNGQNVTFASGLGSSTGQLNKMGAGTLTLNGVSTYAGDTRITAGILRLGASDRIGNASRLVLAGGTFNANGFDEILGTLQVVENSVIDMGSGDSVLQFDESFGETWTAGKVVTITNWSGNKEGTGADRIYIGTAANGLTETQLAQIQFVNPEGMAPGTYGAMMLSDGQVVAPEPASVALITLGAASLLSRRRRRA
jgi:autotransporter-associated beta strand protein